MKHRLFLALAAALCAVSICAAQGAAPPELTDSERELARSSRAAVIAAGFSPAFFDRHFAVHTVSDRPGDRRVVWHFRAHGYETYVGDSVGSYTDARGRRANIHSVSTTLAGARDIRRTITRPRAERIMRACIGEFEGGAIVFQQFGPRPRAALVFTAATVTPTAAVEPPPAPPEPTRRSDRPRRGGRRGPPIYLGAVDLETGRCVKGLAQVGAPKPAGASTRPRR